MFTHEAMRASLIFAQKENQKIAIDQLVGDSSRSANATQWNVQKERWKW